MTAAARTLQKGRLAPLLVAAAMALSLAGTGVDADAQIRERLPRVERPDVRPLPNQTRPLPEIVAQVQATPPYNGMDYIGLAGFESRSLVYVLRFLDGRQVVVVHVDARSGRILSRTP